MNDYCSWVFFAANAKPTSMRRAIGERLAEKNPVVIVDQPVSVLRDHKVLALEKRSEPVLGSKGGWRYRPMHYPERVPGVGKISHLINRLLLQREIDRLLPRDRKRIVCYDSPTQDHLVGKLKEDLTIYFPIDDKTITLWGEPISGELQAEKRLLGKVEKVVCVSKVLSESLRSRVPWGRTIPIYVLPNGYDERTFNPEREYPEPPAIREISRPRILVAGHVSERIDWEGIQRAVNDCPKWTWVFVGPADEGMEERIVKLLGKCGFYHPPILLGEVPAWILHCDACAVPYRLNPFTLASSPLKAIESLAMGVPLLSTPIPSLKQYQDAIYWVEAGESETYRRALEAIFSQAEDKNMRFLRQRAVAGDSLSSRVEQFRQIVFNNNRFPLRSLPQSSAVDSLQDGAHI
jgi:glycosyltransferase involved in cell wall biosynthesis